MFALATPIKTRLAALSSLSGWQVRTNLEEVTHTTFPAVEIRVEKGGAGAKGGAVGVDVVWGVRLIAEKGAETEAALDAAFWATVASLHNWLPGTAAGVPWQPMQLVGAEMDDAEQGLVAYSLIFRTSATQVGQR